MSNPKIAFLVRTRLSAPNPTQISYAWAEAVERHFKADGWQVIELAEDDAIRANVENTLETGGSIVFLFYGHGSPDEMTGQDGTALVDLANVNLLKNQRVYVVACCTAKVLGKASDKIASFYLGYEGEVFVWSHPYAKYLEKCVNRGILAMLDTPNCTIEAARQYIIDEYNLWIDYFAIGTGASGFYSADFASDLRRNRDSLAQVFGDKIATLTD